MQNWSEYIFSGRPFREKVIKVFRYQYLNNPVYRRFCDTLKGEGILDHVKDDISQIPLLPVRAFKDANVTCNKESEPDLVFKSSGTGGMEQSVHRITDAELYRKSVLKGFNHFYPLDEAVILGYTPGYSDNPHSSLIWMINELIKQDDIKKSRFLKLDKPLSQGEVDDIQQSGKTLILFGAAFGLLDLVELSSVKLPSNSIVIETGGMKTHRRKLDRKTMHQKLADGFGLDISRIHSEYGMCELLSQAYATGGKWFHSVPWMKVSIRNPDDQAEQYLQHHPGLIGIIDLANVHSCSFLLTGDRGTMDEKGRFQVLGRWYPKDLRGCNFLIDED